MLGQPTEPLAQLLLQHVEGVNAGVRRSVLCDDVSALWQDWVALGRDRPGRGGGGGEPIGDRGAARASGVPRRIEHPMTLPPPTPPA